MSTKEKGMTGTIWGHCETCGVRSCFRHSGTHRGVHESILPLQSAPDRPSELKDLP